MTAQVIFGKLIIFNILNGKSHISPVGECEMKVEAGFMLKSYLYVGVVQLNAEMQPANQKTI